MPKFSQFAQLCAFLRSAHSPVTSAYSLKRAKDPFFGGKLGPMSSRESLSEPHRVDPRLLFAHERTLLAWVRTGIALIGLGFVLARFALYLREIEPASRNPNGHPFSLWLGISLVAAGLLVNVLSIWQHKEVIGRLKRGEVEFVPSVSPGVILAGLMSLAAVVMIVYLLVF